MRIGYNAIPLLCACAVAASGAYGQDFPNKPIRIVTSEAGGNGDLQARLIAQAVSAPLGQQVIVENRGNVVAPEVVMKAAPDGYTLLLAGSSFVDAPLLKKTSYDPLKDFSPITLAASLPLVLVVHPSLPVKSVKELIALAKAKPAELNCSSSPSGSLNYLAAELFKVMAGVKIVVIPYKGGGPALNDVIAGQVHLAFSPAPQVAPHIKTARLRPLAVTSAAPSALAPGLPTVADAGLPGYESVSITALFAPAKTPPAIINRLNQELVRVLNRPDVKERFFNAGVDTIGSTPEQLVATMKAELAGMSKVIKEAGLRAE